MNNKIIDYMIIFFIFILLSITIEGYVCKYNLSVLCQNFFFRNMWYENGFVELLQFFFLITAIIFLILIFRENLKKLNFLMKVFLSIKILGLIYFAGEEISWGQHFFHWNTPEFIKEINNQEETNLHNISNLFDQLPRSLVLIWCSLSIIVALLLNKIILLDNSTIKIIFPNKKLILISIILIIYTAPDLVIDKFNLHSGYVDSFGLDIPEAKFWDLLSLNFLRLSELHEFIFTFYFLIYSIMLRNTYSTKYNKIF